MSTKPTEETPVTPVVADDNLLTEVLGSLNNITKQKVSASIVPEEKSIFSADGALKSRH